MLTPAIRSGDAPLISVGMPAYNAQPYIGAAIESILGQTLQDWEHPDNISGPPQKPADLRRCVRIHNENYLVMRSFFDGISPDLFREAFGRQLIRPSCETELERRCEQAFLYLKSPNRRVQLIGLEGLADLLADPRGEKVLNEKYGFTSHSFAHGPLAIIDIENWMLESPFERGGDKT